MPARDALPRTVPQSKTLIKKLHGKEQDDETLDYLQTYLKKLTPYEAKIRPFYDRFSKTKIIEKLRDYALMNERHSEHAYAGLKKRMMEEFRKNHPQEEPSQNNS